MGKRIQYEVMRVGWVCGSPPVPGARFDKRRGMWLVDIEDSAGALIAFCHREGGHLSLVAAGAEDELPLLIIQDDEGPYGGGGGFLPTMPHAPAGAALLS